MNKIEIDLDVAQEIGIDGYLILTYIDKMVDTNRKLQINNINGDYWMSQSIAGFMKVYGLFSRSKIINILNKLIDDGYILKFNIKNDSGSWMDNIYTITEKGKSILSE